MNLFYLYENISVHEPVQCLEAKLLYMSSFIITSSIIPASISPHHPVFTVLLICFPLPQECFDYLW